MASFELRELDLGPEDLVSQLPIRARVVRQMACRDRDDYLAARLERPIKYHYPAEFDTGKAHPKFLARDADGPYVSIHVIVVCARIVGERLHPEMKSFPVNIAYVIDNRVGINAVLDFAKIEYVGVGFVDDVPDAVSPAP